MKVSKGPWATAAFCFLAVAAALAAQAPARIVFDGLTHEGTILGTVVVREPAAEGVVRYWFVPGEQVARLDIAGLQVRPGIGVDVATVPAGTTLSDDAVIAAVMGGGGIAVRREPPSRVLRGLLGEVQTLENQRQLVPFIRFRTGADIAAIPAELFAGVQP